MGQTLGDFLKITSADDSFMINVHKNKSYDLLTNF